MSIASLSARPSPSKRRVGICIDSFEACSNFTHVTAHWIARPPMATFVTRLRHNRLPCQAARQLPDQSTTLRMEPSSIDDARRRGALLPASYPDGSSVDPPFARSSRSGYRRSRWPGRRPAEPARAPPHRARDGCARSCRPTPTGPDNPKQWFSAAVFRWRLPLAAGGKQVEEQRQHFTDVHRAGAGATRLAERVRRERGNALLVLQLQVILSCFVVSSLCGGGYGATSNMPRSTASRNGASSGSPRRRGARSRRHQAATAELVSFALSRTLRSNVARNRA